MTKSPLDPGEREAPDSVERPGSEEVSAGQAAEYIAEITAELAGIARRSGLDALAYFLEMARTEALTGPKRPARRTS